MSEDHNTYENITKECVKCEAKFTFSKGEQHFYDRKGFPPPKICPACRERRKRRKDQKVTAL